MGAISRVLSLRVSASLTLTAGRVRGISPLPYYPFKRLLPLVLIALGFIAGAPEAAADEVRLLSQIKTRTEKRGTVGTNSYDGLSVSTHVQDSNYTYQRGSTYTNWGFYDRSEAFGFGTNPPVSGYGTWIYQDTNSASLPWEGEALAPQGTAIIRHTSLVRMDEWVWNGDTNVWTTKSILDGSTNTYTNYMATTEGSPWPMKDWDYSITNENGNTESDKYTLTTTVELVTDGPTNQSALFCLSSLVVDHSALDPVTFLPVFYLSGWEIVELPADNAGRVFKVLDNNSTHDVSVKLGSTLISTVTNWTYDDVFAQRVPLVIEWKGSGTNDTNWSQGPLFVLKGTTVNFRVITPGFVDVAWPPGLPTWSGGGASGTNAQISVTFNTVSADANGSEIIVTAGSKATNQVVVFDYTVQFKPDAQGDFTGRAEYPTNFGVGEGVSFSVKSDPAGITPNFVWSAAGMSATGDFDDRSVYMPNAIAFKAGAFSETITVTATLTDPPSAGSSRSNKFTVIPPTNAVLKDYRPTLVPSLIISLPYLVTNSNVGHLENSESCWKVSCYFILPQSVSFHGISVREGAGPYVFSGGYFAGISAELATNGFNAPWQPPSLPAGPLVTNVYATDSQHTAGVPRACTHQTVHGSGAIEPNFLNSDWFGVGPPGTGNQPYPLAHQAFLLTSLSGTIAVEFQLASATFYNVTNVISKRDFFSDASLTIEKAGSGPHTKAYASPTTPE